MEASVALSETLGKIGWRALVKIEQLCQLCLSDGAFNDLKPPRLCRTYGIHLHTDEIFRRGHKPELVVCHADSVFVVHELAATTKQFHQSYWQQGRTCQTGNNHQSDSSCTLAFYT